MTLVLLRVKLDLSTLCSYLLDYLLGYQGGCGFHVGHELLLQPEENHLNTDVCMFGMLY